MPTSDKTAIRLWNLLARLVEEGRTLHLDQQQVRVPNPASATGRVRLENTGDLMLSLHGIDVERHLEDGVHAPHWRVTGRTLEQCVERIAAKLETARSNWKENAPQPSREEEIGDPPTGPIPDSPPSWSYHPDDWRTDDWRRRLINAIISRDERWICENCGHRAMIHSATAGSCQHVTTGIQCGCGN